MKGIFDSDVDNTSAVTATGTNGANAIIANADSGRTIRVHSDTNTGVESTGHIGVKGFSFATNGAAISGTHTGNNPGGRGVEGFSDKWQGVYGHSIENAGVVGESAGTLAGVLGQNTNETDDTAGPGVHGISRAAGVWGESTTWHGIVGFSQSTTGGAGIYGQGLRDNPGVVGFSSGKGDGVVGESHDLLHAGVHGTAGSGYPLADGVFGEGFYGVVGRGSHISVWGNTPTGDFPDYPPYAGYFSGRVHVSDILEKPAGGFKIDHPLDPENKYLYHSFVESPDMLNIYNGNSITDVNGDVTIKLPDYFEALNEDFRYQLTVIGQFAQAIVAEEIRNNQFTIKTDQPNVRVSWQVTGARKDHFANMRRNVTEEDKPADERGLYLHPEAHGKPETQGIRSLLEKRSRAQGGQHAP
jgi:hypothetical protein